MYKNLQCAAQEFYAQLSREGWTNIEERSKDVQQEIEDCGFYEHTTRELRYGAQLAWRNSARCIGRLHWRSLKIRDQRHLTNATDIFASLVEHIICATNGGKIIPTMTIFAPQRPGEPGIQILNSQLIQYAGYMLEDGSVLGDRASVDLTEKMRQWGWQPPTERSAFDLLPIAIQISGQSPRLFDLPPEIVLEVPLQHPCYPWFTDLQLQWYALPAISNMRLEIGGISYTAAPFSGWYMGTEIGARDLADEHRYNMLPVIAQRLGLDTNKDRSLWKDRALVELNLAVLHSFAQRNVMIVDHHTAAKQFMRYMEREHSLGRDISADWGWIIPPLSPATTPVFHCPMHEEPRSPNFFTCAR